MPDGAHIITVSDTASIGQDAFVRLWDRNGTLAASLNVPDAHPTTEVHCDPESRFFCLESSATIRIFDLRGQLLATLAAARGTHVVDMTIQSDGAQVAALFSDGRVRIWDLKSKRRTITLAVGDAARICFSSDSSRLLAASPSGLIEQYALNIEDLFPDAALRVNRELTAEEIDRFAIQKPVELDLDSYRRHP
jgi:WD40 repeat protein